MRERSRFFFIRAMQACDRASVIGRDAYHCFLDSDPLTHEAYLRVDGAAVNLKVEQMADQYRWRSPSLSVLCLASEDLLRQRIRERNRPGESAEGVIRHVLDVQQECERLASADRTLIVRREDENFLTSEPLHWLWDTIQAQLR